MEKLMFQSWCGTQAKVTLQDIHRLACRSPSVINGDTLLHEIDCLLAWTPCQSMSGGRLLNPASHWMYVDCSQFSSSSLFKPRSIHSLLIIPRIGILLFAAYDNNPFCLMEHTLNYY